ncbi:MAG TPA: PilN domain-containing protein [Burkholderiales bacterium]|nr:PilN domain-containing protein [Burkholderiales bacterium]
MQALQLDFCRTRKAPRWIAPALMAIAVALMGDVGVSFLRVHKEVKEKETMLARLDPRSYPPVRKASPEEIALAKETVQRLSMPWDRLFGALEAAANDQVALLGIQPDPKSGSVVISGDSKDYLAALTYVLNLSRTDALDQVQLSRHETKKDQGKVVGFSISAQWTDKPSSESSRGGK